MKASENEVPPENRAISKNSGVFFSIQTTYLVNFNRALKSLTPWKMISKTRLINLSMGGNNTEIKLFPMQKSPKIWGTQK